MWRNGNRRSNVTWSLIQTIYSSQVPVTLLCSISEPLYNIIATHFRDPQRKPIFDKSEAYPFWWLMNFLRNVCCVPNAEGLARLLQMGHKYEIQPVVQLSRSVSDSGNTNAIDGVQYDLW